MTSQCAVEFEDYLPKEDKITFRHNETYAKIDIQLMTDKVVMDDKLIEKLNQSEEKDEEDTEEPDIIFKVKLHKPEPNGVKISKKNICLVTIMKGDGFDKEEAEKQKLIDFYMA